jgi:uncharacterized membrane protein
MKNSPAAARYDRLDALRGAAMVWMVGFHFCFDLAHFHLTQQNFYIDPRWTVQRTCIVALFMFCTGLGQAVAGASGQGWPRFWKRWAQVAGCAVLVSAGSYLMFPRSFISFGVLHGVAVMWVVVRLTLGAGRWLWVLGALAVAAPHGVRDAFFDQRWTNWMGLVTHKPITEDFVPVLPWLGAVWWGAACGQWLLHRHGSVLSGAVPRVCGGLVWLGRRPLTVYMVHQPVLVALVAGLAWCLRL